MIDDGMTIISNSWSYCEDQTTAADVAGIDRSSRPRLLPASAFSTRRATPAALVSTAARTPSACRPERRTPRSGRLLASVGRGAPFIYSTETWWNGSASTPINRQRRLRRQPLFQPARLSGWIYGSHESLGPRYGHAADPATVSVSARPVTAAVRARWSIGGTSMSAPAWPPYTALLNQAQGTILGFLNPLLYPLSASPGSIRREHRQRLRARRPRLAERQRAACRAGRPEFGRGDATELRRRSCRIANCPPTATRLRGSSSSCATPTAIRWAARPSACPPTRATDAIITPASVGSNAANGAAVFTITDGTIETLELMAHDIERWHRHSRDDTIDVGVATGSADGILAFPTTVRPTPSRRRRLR